MPAWPMLSQFSSRYLITGRNLFLFYTSLTVFKSKQTQAFFQVVQARNFRRPQAQLELLHKACGFSGSYRPNLAAGSGLRSSGAQCPRSVMSNGLSAA